MTAPARRTRRQRWLLRDPSPAATGRLFCLPYSGCGASMYRQWPRFIGGLEVCPVQPPGRENRMREAPLDTYEELARQLIPALEPYLDRPFGFFGHCGSALSAYEIAVQLEHAGGPVAACVFASSQVAPHEGPYGSYLTMNDEQLSDELRILIRQMGGNPLPQLVELCLDVMRADVAANARYRMSEPVKLRAPLVALGWEADTNVSYHLMGGWFECTQRPAFELLKGAHFQFLEAPGDLQAVLARYLGDAGGAAG